jgi:hypothetical protein
MLDPIILGKISFQHLELRAQPKFPPKFEPVEGPTFHIVVLRAGPTLAVHREAEELENKGKGRKGIGGRERNWRAGRGRNKRGTLCCGTEE